MRTRDFKPKLLKNYCCQVMFYQSMTCAWVEALALLRGIAIMDNDNAKKNYYMIGSLFALRQRFFKSLGRCRLRTSHVERPSPGFEDLEEHPRKSRKGLTQKSTPITFDYGIGLSSNSVQSARLSETRTNQFSNRIRLKTP